MLRIHAITEKQEDSAQLRKKKFACNECGKYFSTKASLKAHTDIIHLKMNRSGENQLK